MSLTSSSSSPRPHLLNWSQNSNTPKCSYEDAYLFLNNYWFHQIRPATFWSLDSWQEPAADIILAIVRLNVLKVTRSPDKQLDYILTLYEYEYVSILEKLWVMLANGGKQHQK